MAATAPSNSGRRLREMELDSPVGALGRDAMRRIVAVGERRLI
jgi:hypothetical protein